MKNSIFINIDTERENPIVFSKPEEITPPQTREEAEKMILNDLACLSEAIKHFILFASKNGYGDRTQLAVSVVNTIYDSLKDEEEKKEEDKNEPN
jgi:hypothetical protein